MKIYLISGLGADERAFKHLRFPAGFEPVYIKWIEPDRNEGIESYCTRLVTQINRAEPFILLGMSFGGIVALELSKICKVEKLILLSSIVTYREMPVMLRIGGMLHLNKIVPKFLLTQIHPLTYWFFGADEQDERELLRTIIEQASPVFVKWAINIFLHWQGDFDNTKLFRIHGSKDKLLPLHNRQVDYCVKDGGHFMVYTRAEEVSEIINSILTEYEKRKFNSQPQ